MNEYVERCMKKGLVWFPEKEFGWYPVKNTHYDDNYFDTYVNMERTEISKCLNEFRVDLVNEYTKGLVLDIGIGCGTFIKKRDNCVGYDICPKATYLLQKKDLFFNPYNGGALWRKIKGVTFFDSLEHLQWPELIFNHIDRQFIFISIPIFRDVKHLLRSKHLKKEEHYLYFTDKGFIKYMANYGFQLVDKRDDETACGREDIKTYVLRRRPR